MAARSGRAYGTTLVRVAALLCLPALQSCFRSDAHRQIVAIPEVATDDRYLVERAAMEETAAKNGLSIRWQGPSDADAERQVNLLTAAVHDAPFGIAINPSGTRIVAGAVSAALSRNIPVVVLGNPIALKPQQHLSAVLEDYGAGADMIAQRLTFLFPHGATIAIAGIDSSSDNSLERLDALDRALRQKCPDIKVVDRIVASSRSGRIQVETERALSEHPDLSAFVTLSAQSAFQVVRAVSPLGQRPSPKILAFDQSLPLLLRVRGNVVDSVAAQNVREMGQEAIQNILDDRAGKPYPHQRFVAPFLITRENIDQDRIQDALILNWDTP